MASVSTQLWHCNTYSDHGVAENAAYCNDWSVDQKEGERERGDEIEGLRKRKSKDEERGQREREIVREKDRRGNENRREGKCERYSVRKLGVDSERDI